MGIQEKIKVNSRRGTYVPAGRVSYALIDLTHSMRQQHAFWSQVPVIMVLKQSKFPSFRWIALIRSLLEYLSVSLIPKDFAFFWMSDSLSMIILRIIVLLRYLFF